MLFIQLSHVSDASRPHVTGEYFSAAGHFFCFLIFYFSLQLSNILKYQLSLFKSNFNSILAPCKHFCTFFLYLKMTKHGRCEVTVISRVFPLLKF